MLLSRDPHVYSAPQHHVASHPGPRDRRRRFRITGGVPSGSPALLTTLASYLAPKISSQLETGGSESVVILHTRCGLTYRSLTTTARIRALTRRGLPPRNPRTPRGPRRPPRLRARTRTSGATHLPASWRCPGAPTPGS